MTILELTEDLAAEAGSLHNNDGQYMAVSTPVIAQRFPNGNVLATVFTLLLNGRMVSVSVEYV